MKTMKNYNIISKRDHAEARRRGGAEGRRGVSFFSTSFPLSSPSFPSSSPRSPRLCGSARGISSKFLLPFLLFALLSCEQPFKAGLGPVVDTRPPTVTLTQVVNGDGTESGVGDFVNGRTVFKGTAEDDYKLDSVWLKIMNYPDPNLNPFHDWVKVTLNEAGVWDCEIDTSIFDDGDLILRLRAVDSVNKEAITDDLAFTIKNTPPEVSLGFPLITTGNGPGYLGGRHLNYYEDNWIGQPLPAYVLYERKLDAPGMIVGMIRDNKGINTTVNDPGEHKFVPQYRLWRVDDQAADRVESWPPESPPTEQEFPWKNFALNGNLIEVGINSFTFTLDLEDYTPERFYALQVRVQSVDGSEFEYPKNCWSGTAWSGLPEESKIENSYALIYLRLPPEPPQLELYQFENILGDGGVGADAWKNGKYEDIPGVDKNGNHPYVNRTAVNKSGPFTLRVKASHSEGIRYAVVYWEKNDRSQKGRFIWDPASDDPWEGWPAEKVKAGTDYSEWGYDDPHSVNEIRKFTVRSFIFTHHDDGTDRVPATDALGNPYPAHLSGKPKIQTFTGTDAEWANKLSPRWPAIPEPDDSYWEFTGNLDQGTYNIEVWTATPSGTKNTIPLTCSISIDRTPPDIALNNIEGSISPAGSAIYTVNGVVRPKFLLSDSLPTDTGFRGATEAYFKRPDGNAYGYEQRYILVAEADASKLNAYLQATPWPPVPASSGDPLSIPDVTVRAHGPIFESQFLLKTSPIYPTTDPYETYLPDGRYLLYVLGRDNAFNTGRSIFTIIVDASTDIPRINAIAGNVDLDVDDPDVSADWPASNAGKGFVISNGQGGRTVRNKFNANTAIRLRLTDDDSLDLGVAGGAASGVKVQFIGGHTDADKLVAWDDSYLMQLDDLAIKAAFGVQPVDERTGKRLAVKEKQGEITQQVLLKLLTDRTDDKYDYLFGILPGDTEPEKAEKKAVYNSLPSGVYRVTVSIADYNDPAIKLVMKSGDPDAEIARAQEEFWIVVDNVSPEVSINSPPANGFISGSEDVDITGVVSDLNGPINVERVSVDPAQTDGAVPVLLCAPGAVAIVRDPLETDKFKADFTATVNLKGNSGVFTFTFDFRDRFGNARVASIRYQVDQVPPTVGLTKTIPTFERDESDVTLTGPTASDASVNKQRLANGIVDFKISATDNFKVTKVRWWLLPVNVGATSTGLDTTGLVSGFDSYPADSATLNSHGVYYDSTNGAYGEIDWTVSNSDKNYVVVDTNQLTTKDGEYRLHVIAVDEAGNTSGGGAGAIVQTVFILQEEDKPYFSADAFTPREDAVIDKPVTIQGMIFEDDGFDPEASIAVHLWFSNSGAAYSPGEMSGAASPPSLTNYTGPIAVRPGDITVTGKTLTLRIPLTDNYNSSGLSLGSDGKKTYVIRVFDSIAAKIQEDGDTETDTAKRAWRAQAYSFILDTQPPEVAINAPLNNSIYGNGSAQDDFEIRGYLKDANLKKNSAGHYYFTYWLDGWTDSKEFDLGPDSGSGSYITSISPADQVNFTIPANIVTSQMMDLTNNTVGYPVTEGLHVLTFRAEDLSGKDTETPLNFTLDNTPPTFSLNGLSKYPLPIGGSDTDFNAIHNGSTLTWWDANNKDKKHEWLYDKPDSPGRSVMISYNSTPSISGMFNDTVSDIDTSTFKYYIDDDSTVLTTNVTWQGSGKSARWTIDLPSTLADGAHTIRLVIADTSGNISDDGLYYLFILDSAAPTNAIDPNDHSIIGVTGDINSAFASGTIFTLTGSATDANLKEVGLKIVEQATGAQIYPAGNDYTILPNTAGTWTYAPSPEKFEWSWQLTTTIYAQLVTNGFAQRKNYEIVTEAVDWYGNKSEKAVWSFMVTPDTPKISFDGGLKPWENDTANNRKPSDFSTINNDGAYVKGTYHNQILTNVHEIRGSVSDSFSAIKELQYHLEKWDYGTGASTWTTVDTAWADFDDYTDNTSLQVIWNLDLTAKDQGFYRIQVRAKNGAYNENTDSYLAGAPGNPAVSDYVYFFYDDSYGPSFDPNVNKYYTTRYSNGTLSFAGTSATPALADPNRVRRMTVKTTVNMTNGGTQVREASWSPSDADKPASLAWNMNITGVTFEGGNYVKDGNYTLEFTATDMAGNDNRINIPFILDSTRPGGSVTEPAPQARTSYPDASVVVLGGEVSAIAGRTNDSSSVSNAESGVAGVWYHLGFKDGSTNWPTEADLMSELSLTGADSGSNNSVFDAAANNASGNAWFKLGGTQVPTGFTITNTNIYDWRMQVWGDDPNTDGVYDDGNGFKVYANPIMLKGRQYNAENGNLWLTQRVPEASAGRAGIYRMPLWIRVADEAGNVGYFCRDIWIYPDADIPTTTIINPQPGNKESPRGGSIGADGTATNNVSVYAVIYRVWADNKTTPEAAIDASSHQITLDNGTSIADNRDWSAMQAILAAKGINTSGWYLADSLVGWGGPNVPWSFTFNTNQEITSRISTWGFSSTGGATNDTIRVRLEVIVFKGDAVPQRISIGPNPGTDAVPLPFTSTFFMSEDAPEITSPRISKIDYADNDFETYAGRVVRRGKFAVQADLRAHGSGKYISDISIRLKNELASTTAWTPVWGAGAGTVNGITVTASQTVTANDTAVLKFVLDSATASAGSYYLRNGGWANSGGAYSIEVRVRDSGMPAGEAFQTFDIGVDNFAPVADTVKNITSPKVAGSVVAFLGRAFDYFNTTTLGITSPADQKVQKVYAWFTKTISGTDYVINYRQQGQEPVSGLTLSESAYKNRTATMTWTDDAINSVQLTALGAKETVRYPADKMANGLASGLAVEISQGTALPGSGISWLPGRDDGDITWSFIVDTTVLPDGKITLNYLVYDEAGNVSYYTQETVVMNKYPFISRVTLHTDNRGIGAVFTTHETTDDASSEYAVPDAMTDGYLNTGFISKNKFIGFELRTLYGNAPLNYRLHYVTRKQVVLNETNLKAMVELGKKARGESYNSALFTGSSLTENDANLFTIKQWGVYGGESSITDAWKDVGVATDRPKLGTHFVFSAKSADNLKKVEASDTGSAETQVWAYTPLQQKGNLTGVTDNDAVGWTSNEGQRDSMSFSGDTYFSVSDTSKIGQMNGSHPPELNDGVANNPNTTAFFLIKVWDSVVAGGEYDQLYDAIVIGMNVYLQDVDKPKVRLYDLNPYTETAVSGNNLTDTNRATTIRNAADPRGIGRNILRGGLFNINTNASLVKSGHIEPRNNTTALKPPFNNPGAVENELGSYDRYDSRNADGFWAGDANLPATSLNVADTNANTSFTLDQVSGRIILRGIAWDDQLIRNIRIKIGSDADLTILQLDTVSSSPTYRTMVAPSGVQAYAFETLHWKNGHTVEWAYVWDTETKPARTAGQTLPGTTEVTINVYVTDQLGNSEAGLSADAVPLATETATANAGKPITDTTKVFHNQINVNIAPYIVGFERKKPEFATTRSLQGWYSFYRGETDINLLGYNLKGTGDTRLRMFTSATASYVLTTGNTQNVINTAKTDYTRYLNHLTFSVPSADTALSGQIFLRVNGSDTNAATGTAALNHSTNDAKSWNREYWQNTAGSELWVNKPHAHIWRSATSTDAPQTFFTGSNGGLDSPSMKLIYTPYTTFARTGNSGNTYGDGLPSVGNTNGNAGGPGTLIGAWSTYSAASVFMARNAGTTTRVAIEPFSSEPFSKADLGFYNGSANATNTNGGAAGSAYSILEDWEEDGQSTVELKSTIQTNQDARYRYRQFALNQGVPNQRWQNLRVVIGNGYNYISVFDGVNHNLRYVRGTNTTTTANSTSAYGTNAIVLDGPSASANVTSQAVTGYTAPTTAAAAGNAGQFNAIDYDATGPVIAYYDGDTVRLAFGMGTDPGTGTNQWRRRNVLPDGHDLFHNSGQYISMKIDSTKTISNESTIHLAFFNSAKSTVVYAVGSRTTAFKAYTIDRVIAGGVWTNVSVDSSGNPYIVYGDMSRANLRDGVRVAYRDNSLFTKAINDTNKEKEDITGWEAVTVPSNYPVREDRLCIEVWPPVNRAPTGTALGTRPTAAGRWNWDIAVGYPGGATATEDDLFRLAYYIKPTWKGYN